MNIPEFSHDRTSDFREESKKIFKIVENFGNQIQLKSLLHYYESKYSLPKEVSKKVLKQTIIRKYKYKSARFDESLKLHRIPISMVNNILSFIKPIFYNKSHESTIHYKLIIDDIRDDIQLMRFLKLIDLVGRDNTLIVVRGKVNMDRFSGYNIVVINHYDRKYICQSLRYELFIGIWICLKVSLGLSINLFPLHKGVVKGYWYYKTLFDRYTSDYIIQERHYTTSAIKNYLFKESGGIASTSIQKNLIENDQAHYYIDIDYLFSLGEKTIDITFEYGARIDKVIPVGSMFMEYYWFNKPKPINKNIDVILLGINTMNAYERLDKYVEFMDDYYNSIRWLVRFKKEHPSYRVVIKHHGSAGDDEIENKIIIGSGVEVLPKSGNSYKLAFNSRCVVTYGSTMCHEMNAHGVPSFSFDPGNRSTLTYDLRNNNLDFLRLQDYNSFKNTIISVLEEKNGDKLNQIEYHDLCMESSMVSNKIYNTFMN